MHHASPPKIPIQHDSLSDGSLEMEKAGVDIILTYNDSTLGLTEG